MFEKLINYLICAAFMNIRPTLFGRLWAYQKQPRKWWWEKLIEKITRAKKNDPKTNSNDIRIMLNVVLPFIETTRKLIGICSTLNYALNYNFCECSFSATAGFFECQRRWRSKMQEKMRNEDVDVATEWWRWNRRVTDFWFWRQNIFTFRRISPNINNAIKLLHS